MKSAGNTALNSIGATSATPELAGRILVVEDEALVALDLEDMLRDMGFQNVTVCSSVRAARNALASTTFEFAVFDLNLDGESSVPLIQEVAGGETRIVVASGYDATSMPLPRNDIPRITKPYRASELRQALLG